MVNRAIRTAAAIGVALLAHLAIAGDSSLSQALMTACADCSYARQISLCGVKPQRVIRLPAERTCRRI